MPSNPLPSKYIRLIKFVTQVMNSTNKYSQLLDTINVTE